MRPMELTNRTEGIFPVGRLDHLVRAASPGFDAAKHWQLYVDGSRNYFPNEGEFRQFPIVKHRLGSDVSIAENDVWLNETRFGPHKVPQDKLSGSQQSLQVLLESYDIPFLWTKGSVLSRHVYQDKDLRPTSDLDLILPHGYLPHLTKIATAKQWELKVGNPTYSAKNRYSGVEVSWLRPDGISVDACWMPRAVFAFDPWMMTYLFADGRGQSAHTPDANWLLLETIEHGLVANEVYPIRWVVDALWILDRFGDQISDDFLIDVANRYRLNVILAAGLEVIANYSDRITPQLISAVRGNKTNFLQRHELSARLALVDSTDQYWTSVLYNFQIRAPADIYRRNQQPPFTRRKRQTLLLRLCLAQRNFALRVKKVQRKLRSYLSGR